MEKHLSKDPVYEEGWETFSWFTGALENLGIIDTTDERSLDESFYGRWYKGTLPLWARVPTKVVREWE